MSEHTPPRPPDLAELRTWLNMSIEQISDAHLGDVLASELANQAEYCTVEPYTHDLRVAVFRRCARQIAAKPAPLGITGDAEFGHSRLPLFDAEIERLEGPARRFVFG